MKQFFFHLCCVAVFLLIPGCAADYATVSIKPQHDRQKLIQNFTRSYISRDAAGDYQIVLLDDPIDRVPVADAGKPLSAAKVPPVRQVLHLRLLWRPLHGTADSPAASNASLHWYVIGTRTVQGTGLVHYAGTAFVTVSNEGDHANITVKNGEMRVVDVRGELTDPLQSFTLDGKFRATNSQRNVDEILADVKTSLGESKKLTGAR